MSANLLLAVLAVLVTGAGFEVALCVYHTWRRDQALARLPPVEQRSLVPSVDPELLYRLNPKRVPDTQSRHVFAMPNSAVPLDPAPGRFRIAFFGDSITAGVQRPPRGDSFVELLTRELNARRSDAGAPVEALNFAVKGYGIVQTARSAELEVPRYRPDRVVVQLCLNDPSPSPNPYVASTPPRSRLFDFLFLRLSPARFWAWKHVGSRYDEAGWARMRDGLQRLGALGRDGPRLQLVLFPYFHLPAYSDGNLGEIHARIAREARRAAVPLLDLYESLHEAGLIPTQWPGDAIHPTGPAHAVAARALEAELGLTSAMIRGIRNTIEEGP